MRSAARTVERRWAMMMLVRFCSTVASAVCTWASVSGSMLAVASSSSRMAGFCSSTRARATSCRCPNESRAPRSPTSVCKPSGKSASQLPSPNCRRRLPLRHLWLRDGRISHSPPPSPKTKRALAAPAPAGGGIGSGQGADGTAVYPQIPS